MIAGFFVLGHFFGQNSAQANQGFTNYQFKQLYLKMCQTLHKKTAVPLCVMPPTSNSSLISFLRANFDLVSNASRSVHHHHLIFLQPFFDRKQSSSDFFYITNLKFHGLPLSQNGLYVPPALNSYNQHPVDQLHFKCELLYCDQVNNAHVLRNIPQRLESRDIRFA